MIRIIGRLDIKSEKVIKGVQLEGLRVVGDPQTLAQKYYEQGIDELIFIDVVASLYGRNHLSNIIKKSARDIFVPITVGGGIRSLDDATDLMRSGADKIAINTAAIKNPELITEISKRFGSQAMVLSIEAKQVKHDKWEAYTNNGREKTGLDVLEWAKTAVELGAGEILLTSVDREGTRKGFDLDLIHQVSTQVSVPVIASGGFGKLEHFISVINEGKADAVAIADGFHFNRFTIDQVKQIGLDNKFHIRETTK